MVHRENADEIEEAAVRWVWRLDREGRTPVLEAELQAWLAGDSRRGGALLQAEAAWTLLDGGQAKSERPPAPWFRRRSLLVGGGAAMAASLAGLGAWLSPRERYGTKVGEIRRVPLADGSTAAINTQSTVDVAMSDQDRVVDLARGEAWFHVAKNPDRPFVVKAGDVRVRAVGTAFSVRRLGQGAEVLVTEGVVEAWTVSEAGRKVRIAAGAKAFVDRDLGVIEAIAGASEIDRKLAWRAGQIDLAGETLAEASAEFNRYNEVQLIVADPALRQQRLYGIFRTDDPEGFAKAAGASLGADIVMSGLEIRLGREGA